MPTDNASNRTKPLNYSSAVQSYLAFPDGIMPPDLSAAILAFLWAKKTGNIILNVKQGVVTGAQLHEFLKARVE